MRPGLSLLLLPLLRLILLVPLPLATPDALPAATPAAPSPALAAPERGAPALTPAAFDTAGSAREWLERWRGAFPSLAWSAFRPEGKERAEAGVKPRGRIPPDWERVSTIRWSPSRARALYWCGCREEREEIRLARTADSTWVLIRSYGGGHEAFDAFWPSDSVAVLTHLRSEGRAGGARLVLEAIDLARGVSRAWLGPVARPRTAR
jgi:hypothetical protein